MQDIRDWLDSPTDYQVGISLLRRQDPKAPILIVLQTGESTYNWIRLKRELEALVSNSCAREEVAQTPPASQPSASSFTHRHKINYPAALHPAHDRLMKLYAMVDVIHPRLDLLWSSDRKKCEEHVRALTAAWDEIKGIYRILDYWTENKRVLPNDYEENPNVLPATVEDLVKRRNSLRTYISKHKNNPNKTIKVQEWKDEIAAIEAKMSHE